MGGRKVPDGEIPPELVALFRAAEAELRAAEAIVRDRAEVRAAVVVALCASNHTYKAIGEALGISAARVGQIRANPRVGDRPKPRRRPVKKAAKKTKKTQQKD